jgi:sugar phosphate isomerase/epimerase
MKKQINLGVRGHDISQNSIESLAQGIQKEGFTHTQLALIKALEDYGDFKGRLNVGMMNYFNNILKQSGVRVSVLGCYINMAQPVEKKRLEEIEYFKEHIRFASDLGCKMIGTETGCYTEDYTYTELNETEEAFETFLDTLKKLVEEAEKFGVFIAIEAVKVHIVNTPSKMKKVLDIVKSNNLQVILDPVNLLDETNYLKQDEILKECFELFGDKINAIHTNDFIIENGEKKIVNVGEGILNYRLLFELIEKYKPHVDMLLENYQLGTRSKIINYLENL